MAAHTPNTQRKGNPMDAREIALCGAVLKKAAPFLLLNGRPLGSLELYIRQEMRRFQTRPALQLPLFDFKEGDDHVQTS